MGADLTRTCWPVFSGTVGFSVHPDAPGGWEGPFTSALQLTIVTLDALPEVRTLKDAVRR